MPETSEEEFSNNLKNFFISFKKLNKVHLTVPVKFGGICRQTETES